MLFAKIDFLRFLKQVAIANAVASGAVLALSAERVLGQEGSSVVSEAAELPPLPLPEHPGRTPEAPETTRPKETQPNRESRLTSKSQPQGRRTREMPVPGHPGRGLVPLEDLDSEEPTSSEESAPVEELGIFRRLPHQFRDGGINIEYIYTGETFTKAHGGLSPSQRTNYRSNFDLVGTVDTAKMGWWDNGRLFVYGQNLSGRPLSKDYVGDAQLFSNLDSTISATERPQFTTVAEYWYEHLLLEDRLRFKVGKQDANVDFALSDLGGDFVNSSFGFPPMIPFPTFPSQALGLSGFLRLTDKLILGMGFYDGALPSGPQGVRWGFDTLGHNGMISLYQLEWKPQLGMLGQLPTTIRTGAWHHNDKNVWTEFTDNPNPVTFNQNYGFWTTADQMIWKESDAADDDQGLGIFGQFGWAPSDRNLFQEYYGGGFVYKGLFAGREHDLLGVGFANAMFGSGYRTQSAAAGNNVSPSETAVEVFYKYQRSPFISVQPDIQYIANPGGLYKDALVPGLRFEIVM